MTKLLTAVAFTQGLVEHLERLACVQQIAIQQAKKRLRSRRDLRNEPLNRKGHEYVVEWLLRPEITKYAEDRLGIVSEPHRRIYSSHFHTTSDELSDWRARWRRYKQVYPHVDTDDHGHSRRADLFIAMDEGLVSIEFKYLRAQCKPSVPMCIKQVGQHLTKHRASVLVLYAAAPTSTGLQNIVGEIRTRLRPDNGFAVMLAGPAIEFP